MCRQLAAPDRIVLLSAQRADAARALSSRIPGTRPLTLDVTQRASIDAAAASIEQEYGKLDILINNAAGIAPFGEMASTADLSIAHQVFETTLFGAWRLTQTMVPLLRKSGQGRIVNVTSGAGSHGDLQFGLTTANEMGTSYAVSKAALNALTVKFAGELRPDGILVNAVDPGFTATYPGMDQMGARPVAEGAKGIIWAALLPDGGPSGGFFRDGVPHPW